jgi:hypothetical protein
MRESLNFDPSWLSDRPKFPSWVRLRRSPGIPATSEVGGILLQNYFAGVETQ